MRGKCRWCADSVSFDGDLWWSEATGLFECECAPWRPCGACAGTGVVSDVQGRRSRCGLCDGAGQVPGPHWPWRHPEPV